MEKKDDRTNVTKKDGADLSALLIAKLLFFFFFQVKQNLLLRCTPFFSKILRWLLKYLFPGETWKT